MSRERLKVLSAGNVTVGDKIVRDPATKVAGVVDVAVRVGPPENTQEARGTVGEFYWDGAASTLFWVDPVNQLTVVFFVQTRPNDQTLHRGLRRAIYGDDYLGPARVRQ